MSDDSAEEKGITFRESLQLHRKGWITTAVMTVFLLIAFREQNARIVRWLSEVVTR